MNIVEELRSKVSRDNRELLDRAAAEIEELDRNLVAAYKRIEELEREAVGNGRSADSLVLGGYMKRSDVKALIQDFCKELIDEERDYVEVTEFNADLQAKLAGLKKESKFEAGQSIWVVERDGGEAVDVSSVLFLARSQGCIIATSYINDFDFDETIEYLIEQTSENYETPLHVYPIEDCFATKEEALAKKEARAVSEAKLKPCPKCGETPEIGYCRGEYFIFHPAKVVGTCVCASFAEMHSSEQQEIEAWNRRADNEQREAD